MKSIRCFGRKLLVACLLLCPVSRAGAQFIVTNIAWAKRDLDNNYFPDDPTNNYRIRGRVTSPNFSTNLTELYLQDTNDQVGILVASTAFLVDTNVFKPGVEAQVTDRIDQTNGMRCIRPLLSGRLIVTDPAIAHPPPVGATIAALLAAAESNEARLVVISNVLGGAAWPAWGSSASLSVTDATGTLTLRIDSDTDLDGQLPPTNAFDVIGIFSQFDTSETLPNSGYQVLPRYYTDLVQYGGPQPPLVTVINSNAFYSVGPGATLNVTVVGQDRNAGDPLALSAPVAPAGSTFTDLGSRVGEFSWTPAPGDVGTTNPVVFEATDGTSTGSVSISIYVLSETEANILLNEIHWDPHPVEGDANCDGAVDTTRDEFVEIVNNNTGAVDVTGWVLRLGSNALFTFPATSLTGRTAVVVFGGGTPAGYFGNAQVFAPATNWPGLANSPGDRAVNLLSSYGAGIFSYNYGAFGTPDQSVTRNPDLTGGYALHLDVNPAKRYSPGTFANGKAFPGSGITNTAPQIVPVADTFVQVGDVRTIPVSASDPETNSIRLTISNAPPTATFVSNGYGTATFIYTGAVADAGVTFNLAIHASDGDAAAIESFTLYVVSPTYSGLLINEFLPDPNADGTNIHVDANNDGVKDSAQDEFVEIVNGTGADLDIGGCMIRDGAQLRHVFGSQVVKQGGAIVVFGGGSLVNFSNPPAQVASTGALGLNNDVDTISLYSPATNLIDQASYSIQLNAASWTRNPDFTGEFTNHYEATGGVPASPGRKVTGAAFLTNQPPAILPIGNRSVQVSNLLSFVVRAVESDGDAVSLTNLTVLPANAVFHPTNGAGAAAGTFLFTPDASQAGNVYTTRFYAADKDGADTNTITITVTGGGGGGDCGVILSEYVEGTSNNKALEIYNGTASAISLAADQYVLMLYNNGSNTPTYTIALTGTVASGDAYVIVNSAGAEPALLALADELGTLFYNGDDAVVLRSGGTNGPVVDSMGQVGFDPGEYWGTTNNKMKDMTLRRKASVVQGDTNPGDAYTPETEWDAFPVDTFTDLGLHTMNCTSGPADTDGDGMQDWWEELHFGGPTNATAGAHSDNDSIPDGDEYVMDTIPTNSESFLEVTSISNLAGRAVSFPSSTGRLYGVQESANPLSGGSWSNLGAEAFGAGGPMTVGDTNDAVSRAYRVRVRLP